MNRFEMRKYINIIEAAEFRDVEPTAANLTKILDANNIPDEFRLGVRDGEVALAIPEGEEDGWDPAVKTFVSKIRSGEFEQKYMLSIDVNTGLYHNESPKITIDFASEGKLERIDTDNIDNLFHVTAKKNIPGILQHGIRPGKNQWKITSTTTSSYSNATFLTGDPKDLISNMTTKMPEWSDDKVVVEVSAWGLDLFKDESMPFTSSAITFDHIDADRILRIHSMDFSEEVEAEDEDPEDVLDAVREM